MGLGRIVKTYQGKEVITAGADPYKVKHVEPVLKSAFLHWLPATPSPGTITNTAQIIFLSSKGCFQSQHANLR